MKKYTMMFLTGVLMFTIAGVALISTAQDQGNRRFDPEQFRQMMMNGIKDQLNASDDEWKVLEPMVAKVMDLQREARSGAPRGFMGFGRGGRGGDGPDGGRGGRGGRGFGPELSKEAEALERALESENTSASEIQAKLDAYRDAQKKKESALKKAQDDLRKVLTVRQEATLVLMGTLE
ncbi:MAG: hypothetical protein ACOX5R_14980 [bacterium]